MTANKLHTPEPWVEIIRRKVGAMRYGSVKLTIRDGQIMHCETTEKTRLHVEREAAADFGRKAT